MTTPEQVRREVAPRETEAYDARLAAAAVTAAQAGQVQQEAEATARERVSRPWPSQRQGMA